MGNFHTSICLQTHHTWLNKHLSPEFSPSWITATQIPWYSQSMEAKYAQTVLEKAHHHTSSLSITSCSELKFLPADFYIHNSQHFQACAIHMSIYNSCHILQGNQNSYARQRESDGFRRLFLSKQLASAMALIQNTGEGKGRKRRSNVPDVFMF